GRTMAEVIIPPALRDQHARGLIHYLATGEGPVLGERLELMAQRADGREFPRTGAPQQYESVAALPESDRSYLVVKFPIFDAAGSAYAVATISTDISALKAGEAERELLRARQNASR